MVKSTMIESLRRKFPTNLLDWGGAGLRILCRDLIGKGRKRYKGTASEICSRIIEDRWNGTFFEGGETLFSEQFWIRDFSLNVNGIIDLGHIDKVRKNLAWALDVYEDNSAIGTTILGRRTVTDFWHYSADSLPFLLFSIRESGSSWLVEKHKDFLNREIKKYFRTLYDTQTGLVREIPFSIPKDVIMRNRSCVAGSFMIFTQKLLDESFPELSNLFAGRDLRNPFIDAFWNRYHRYFRNDLERDGDVVSADANIMPYWLGVIDDKKMLKSSIDSIKKEHLDEPFPIKYHSFYNQAWMRTHPVARILTPNYQGDSIWGMLAPFYIEFESRFYPEDAKRHLHVWLDLIEKYRTFVEVFEPDGKRPLGGKFGHNSETGMLWAASFPTLIEKLRKLGNA